MTRNFTALMASTVLAAGLGGAAFAQSTEEALLDRTHKGEIAAHGGARRLPGDITEAFAAEIKGGKVKNVILLIGDGMGDSEITIARNYYKGAAGRFAGIDALTTHYVVLGWTLDLPAGELQATDAQHRELRWFTPAELRSDPAVHPNTRAYFDASITAPRTAASAPAQA